MHKGVLYMVISSFAFSLMQLCVKALPHISIAELVIFRSLVSLSICIFFLRKQQVSIWGNNTKVLLARGFFGIIALTLFFITLQNIPLASAVTIQYMSPIFTAFFAIYIMKEKTRLLQWMFFLMAFAGVLIMKGFDDRISYMYLGLGLLSASFSGLAYNCIRLLKASEHPLVVVAYFSIVALPVFGSLTILNQLGVPGLEFFSWVWPNLKDLGLLLLLGVFTQIAQLYMTKGIQSDKAGNIMSVKYIGTIFAFSFGYFIFGETYSTMSLVGILLVLAGIILNIIFKEKSQEFTENGSADNGPDQSSGRSMA